MFSSGFAESGIKDMDAPYPPTRSPLIELYEYPEDSDLEDEEVEEVGESPSATRDADTESPSEETKALTVSFR